MRILSRLRDAWFLILLLVILAVFSAFVAARQQQLSDEQELFVPNSSHSARGSGTLALYNWLGGLGYNVQRIENSDFGIPDDVRLLFLLGPSEEVTRTEARYILDWVARGNVLITGDERFFSRNGLLDELKVEVKSLDNHSDTAALQQPLLDSSVGPLTTNTYSGLVLDRSDYVTYAAAESKPLLVRIQHGGGTIWVTSAPALVSNDSLRNEQNAKLVQAFLADVPRGGGIAFDEYHLGFKSDQNTGLTTLIYNTPWGWGILFACLLILGYLILNGRRFGRTVPVRQTLARRTPSEYVVSMANLFRRANKRGMVLEHYRHSLKRRLGRPFHLNPELADDRYVELITQMRPDLDAAELKRILASLRRSNAAEQDLVKTVEQSIRFGSRSQTNSESIQGTIQ